MGADTNSRDQSADTLDSEVRIDDRLSQAILDTLTSHVAVVDESGEIIAVNRAWTVFAATNGGSDSARTGVGANYLDVSREASGPGSGEGLAAFSGIRGVLDGLRPQFTLEYPCHSPAAERWFLMTVSPIAETPIKAVVAHLDISVRRVMERDLRQSELQFRELASHLHQALWVLDVKGDKILYVSPGYERIWGRSCQSLMDNPTSFMEGIHPLDQEMMLRERASMYETGQIDVEFRVQRPDGSVRWVWFRGYAVRDERGEAIRFVGIMEDIAERKVSQGDQARLAAIVEFSDDAIVSTDPEGIVITWNEGAERLYGYDAEEIIGRNLRLVYAPGSYAEYLHIRESTGKGESIPSYDTTRLRKDGRVIDVRVSVSPIMVKDGSIVGSSTIAHDITKVKQLEEQFRQAHKMEAVGRLAAGVAHDFNNLLTVINGYSELLISRLPHTDPSRDLLVEINNAGERAGGLTRQLLTFSRQQVIEPVVLNLNTVVQDTERMLRRLIGEDIILTTVLDPLLKPVRVDPGQLQQVLMNLAVNARDAMPRGGTIRIETHPFTLDSAYERSHPSAVPGEYSMLALTDTGTGMDEATRARIFEPFFSTKEAGKGTGLGLAVVHGIVQQSGGYVEAYSELGHGSTFKLYFPLASEALLAEQVSSRPLDMPTGTETILLVEDDAAVRALSRHILESCGYGVIEAADGLEAIAVARDHDRIIHLAVSDVVMPHLGGRQLAEQLQLTRPGLKLLFLSGYTDDAVVRHGILEADVAFLQKPFTPIALAQKVRDVLDQD